MNGLPPAQGLYDPRFEHDACGVGFICHIKGQPSHEIVSNALLMLENMNHRGACGCEENSGDGAGILVRIPDAFLRAKCKELGIKLPKPGELARRHGLPHARTRSPAGSASRFSRRVAREYGMVVLGWRDVPVDDAHVGPTPKKSRAEDPPGFRRDGRDVLQPAPISSAGCIWSASARKT